MVRNMGIKERIFIDTVHYFGDDNLKSIVDILSIGVTEHCFLPRNDDLQADWVSSVAIPAFRLIMTERGNDRCGAFCTIGTGAGIDALAAVETLNA